MVVATGSSGARLLPSVSEDPAPGPGRQRRPASGVRTHSRATAVSALAVWATLAWTILAWSPRVLGQDLPELVTPLADPGVQQIDRRAAQQRQAADQIAAFHDFRLTDRRSASGITFVHEPPADAASAYKMVHYDHGSAIAVADVDGDDRPDLYFVNQIGGNELWRNRGDGTFEHITARSPGLAVADRVSVGASFADIDNDGDPDLYVTTVNQGNRMFRNTGGGRYEDITERSGTGHVAHSSGAVFFDYDRDGLLDLFVTNVGRYTRDQTGPGGYFVGHADAFSGHLMDERTERSVLYRNRGDGRFEDVTEATGLLEDGWNGDATFTDLDGNGFPDLYVLNMQGDDGVWLNMEGKRFVESRAKYFPKTPWGAMGVKFFDWDNDGDFDLYISDMHSDMSNAVSPANEHLKSFMTWDDAHLEGGDDNIFGNAFYRNDGERWTEVSDTIGAENYWPWGLSVGDLNGDGYEDALVTSSMNYPFRYVENALMLNDGGRSFARTEYVVGLEPRAAGPHKPWYQIECPTKTDIDSAPLEAVKDLWRRCGYLEGTHQVVGTRGTRSAAIVDLDGDGDQDLVTGEFHDVPQIFVSDLAERRPSNYLLLDLEGTASNRDGLGAVIDVRAGDRRFARQADGKLGYLGQSSHPIFVGLGDAGKVDSVTVRWPSGRIQTIQEGIRTNRLWTIREPE